MNRILITDSLEASGIDLLREGGATVDLLEEADRPRLHELIGDYDALIVRSATKVTRDLLEAARSLRVVGRAGIGVDNIDVAAATERGVLVVNSPTANLLSATEHTFALLLALARRVVDADRSLKAGTWDRKSHVGVELYRKTLGIVGFGQIGQRVAQRARAFEMEVLAYDPYLNAEVARGLDVEPLEDLDELLRRADAITFHTPLTDQTRGLLDRERLALMKEGALVVNCGRGGVIDEEALLEALDAGRLGGAALDVFAQEPPADYRLAAHPRVVATPHIGAQTHEAQERIATEIARMVLLALEGSLAVSAVNLPFRPAGSRGEPFLRLGELLGRFASAMHGGSVDRVRVDLHGLDDALSIPVSVAALRGALAPFLGEAVNYVNAEALARERGIELVRVAQAPSGEYAHLVRVRVRGAQGEVEVAGTLSGDGHPRVVGLGGFQLEFQPEGLLLVLRNRDVPGVVGRIGTLLGDAGVNIADIHLARRDGEDDAMAVLRLDSAPPDECVAALRALAEARQVDVVDLG
jgi:D-3-phosphoglycerate dehydrogenase / 2-oxoglutarate reductase